MSATAIDLSLADADATTRLGAALAGVLAPVGHGVVLLHGDLGAGKTTLARGLLRALGVKGAVRSPSYTLLEPYTLPGLDVLHMDLYRLVDPDELLQLGLDGYDPRQQLWLVEWPERAASRLPAALLEIGLSHRGAARRVSLRPGPAAPPGFAGMVSGAVSSLG